MADSLPKRRLQISFTDEQIRELQKVSKEVGVTKSAIVAMAVSDWVKRRKNQDELMLSR